MKEESIFHIKVDYGEALESKKDLLAIERDLLKVLRTVKKYELLRKEELTDKMKIYNKMRDLKSNLTKINELLPKIKIPDILKKKEAISEEIIKEEKPTKAHSKDKKSSDEDDLEMQLREIQEKLKKLG